MLMRMNAGADDVGRPHGRLPERPAGTTGSGGAFDVRLFMSLLTWHARLIGAAVMGVVLVAIGLMIFLPPKYTASTAVLLDPREQQVTASQTVLPGIGSDVAAVESQVELVQS